MDKSEMKKKPKHLSVLRVVSIFILGSALSLLLCMLVVGVIYLIVKSKNVSSVDEVGEAHLYHYYQVNPKTKSSSVGLTSLLTKLGNDQFLFYEDEHENYVLISEFETDRYQCTGSCYCADNIERRSHSTTLTNGLLYLAVAVTAAVAMNLAKNHFEEECHSQFESTCPSHAIQSEVKDCEKVKFTPEIIPETGEIRTRSYICHGNCLRRNIRFEMINAQETNPWFEENGGMDQIELMEKLSEDFECEKMTLEGQQALTNVDLKQHALDAKHAAEKMFMGTELDEFCEKNSVEEMDVIMRDPQELLGGMTRVQYPMCMGHFDSINPTVVCVEAVAPHIGTYDP